MRRTLAALSSTILLLAASLSACGGSGKSTTPAPRVRFGSTALTDTSIPSQYTCRGRDISPPLEWGSVPAKTGELAIFVVGFAPEPGTHSESAAIEWAVAGVDPSLHRLAAGKLPPGAHVGVATDGKRGYAVCPKKGVLMHYQFELFALSDSVRISPKFSGYAILGALDNTNSTQRPPTLAHGGFSVNLRLN